jgi:type I restriction enzyme R subunit
VNHRIERINLLENTDHTAEVSGIINEAIAALEFNFRFNGKEELEIVYNDLIDRYYDVKREFDSCFDKQEDRYVSLAEAFQTYFKKKGFTRDDVASVKADLQYMDDVMQRIREINRRNNMLKKKYADDEKFVRIHKRIIEENEKRAQSAPPKKPIISSSERVIAEELSKVKASIDALIYLNINVLANENSFNQDVLAAVSQKLVQLGIEASLEDRKYIRNHIAAEYMNRYAELGFRAGA